MLKSPPLVATLSDSMRMSPCSWGDIFTWPLRGDRIIGLRHYCPFSFTPFLRCTIFTFPPACPSAPQLHAASEFAAWRCLMWRKAEENKAQPPPGTSPSGLPASPNAPVRLSQGIRIKGEISGRGDLFLDGV